jgi:murein DD-endopeptidase MepM/ murein hydrolase activator NlpD
MKLIFTCARLLLGLTGITVFSLIFAANANEITTLLKNKKWDSAARELDLYIRENPEKEWAYSSAAWALENLKRFDEAIARTRTGLVKFPKSEKISTALARILIRKAETLPASDGHPLFIEAATIKSSEYNDYCRARSYRAMGDYATAEKLFKEALTRYPQSERFQNAVPYTMYLQMKAAVAAGDLATVRSTVGKARDALMLPGTKDLPFHYTQILRVGLRELKDRQLFESVYAELFARHPQEPKLYDDYGFQLYANYRLDNPADTQLKKKAIGFRRKAYDLYWRKHTKPAPVRDLEFPLKGRNIIWSEFGGSAMTHNGFSNYCYDFAAVDARRNIRNPGVAKPSNSDYYMFGKPVYAVADGTVSGIIDGFPDNEPGGYSSQANTVTVDHNKYYSFYAHMKLNGITVKVGQRVRRGELLGYVGNSGMSSESHLHFCIDAKSGHAISIPFYFRKMRIEDKKGKITADTRFLREDEVAINE